MTTPRRGRGQAGRFRDLLASEQPSAARDDGLAKAANGDRREVLSELAAVERKHAANWADKLAELGEPVPDPARPDMRGRVLGWLARRFSVATVLPFLERAEHSETCDASCHVTLGRPAKPAAFATLSPPTGAASAYQRTYNVS